MITYVLLFVSIILTVAAQVLIKLGMTKIGVVEFSLRNFLDLIPKVFTNLYLFLGLVSLGFGFMFWLLVLSKLKLSVAIPFTSLNYILVLFFSWLFLRETISLMQFAGVVLVIFGLVLIAR
jgi:drug/metabolite transporter (DMT)-like permease